MEVLPILTRSTNGLILRPFPPLRTAAGANLGFDAVRGPGRDNWNLSLFKSFVISESRGSRVEFRAESFNTWNHTQFGGSGQNGGVSVNYGASNFGAITSAADPGSSSLEQKLSSSGCIPLRPARAKYRTGGVFFSNSHTGKPGRAPLCCRLHSARVCRDASLRPNRRVDMLTGYVVDLPPSRAHEPLELTMAALCSHVPVLAAPQTSTPAKQPRSSGRANGRKRPRYGAHRATRIQRLRRLGQPGGGPFPGGEIFGSSRGVPKGTCSQPRAARDPAQSRVGGVQARAFSAGDSSFRAAFGPIPRICRPVRCWALSCYGARHFAEAVGYLEPLAKSDPTNSELHQVLAQSCLWAKKYDCALQEFRRIVQQSPNSAGAHILTGEALDGLGKTQEAIAEFQAAATSLPESLTCILAWGISIGSFIITTTRRRNLKRSSPSTPTMPRPWLISATSPCEEIDSVQALVLLRRAVENKKDLRIAYIDMGAVLASQKNYDEAIAVSSERREA